MNMTLIFRWYKALTVSNSGYSLDIEQSGSVEYENTYSVWKFNEDSTFKEKQI
jgi:hypothetical protein